MKAPDFWYQPAGMKAALLSPLGQVYRAAGKIRRVLAAPYKASIPVICVGNVVAGGAGKTPTALALAHLLQQQGATPAFATRGYGGLERGPLRVDPDRHNVRDVGDEALMLACAAPCWVGCNRSEAIRAAELHATHIIMDDGLQNPTIAPTINLLVIDGSSGLGNGQIIPAGPLRESLGDALNRSDAVIFIGEDAHNLLPKLDKPVIRATLVPRLPEDFSREKLCFAFAGIGRPEKFYHSCREAGLTLMKTRDFPDHHLFNVGELEEMAAIAEKNELRLITTAKDWVRLPDPYRAQVTVLPAELVFKNVKSVQKILGIKTSL